MGSSELADTAFRWRHVLLVVGLILVLICTTAQAPLDPVHASVCGPPHPPPGMRGRMPPGPPPPGRPGGGPTDALDELARAERDRMAVEAITEITKANAEDVRRAV